MDKIAEYVSAPAHQFEIAVAFQNLIRAHDGILVDLELLRQFPHGGQFGILFVRAAPNFFFEHLRDWSSVF